MQRRKDFGPKVVVTEAFRDDLRSWLMAKGKGAQKKLAQAIGCHPSMISQLLNRPDEIKTSTIVVPIVEKTGIAMPIDASDQEHAQLIAQLRQLRESDPASFAAIAALIRARAPQPR